MGKLYFTCSFDDGDIADIRLADLLKKYNIKGTFYIPKTCDLVYKSLSDREIRHLSNSVEIGGHTISHQILTHTTYERSANEIKDCKSWLEDITGREILAFCPPTGRFNKKHIKVQQEVGFKSMRTVEMLSYSLQQVKFNPDFILLPTTIQVYNHTASAYLKNSLKRSKFKNYFSSIQLYNEKWDLMAKNFIEHLLGKVNCENSICFFHIWGHSWEIQKYDLWDSLELFFKSITAIEGIVFCDNSELANIVKGYNYNEV